MIDRLPSVFLVTAVAALIVLAGGFGVGSIGPDAPAEHPASEELVAVAESVDC